MAKEHSEFMSNQQTLEAMISEHTLWRDHYPEEGDNLRHPKKVIIHRLAIAMARKDRTNPFAYKYVTSLLRQGIMTPEDCLKTLNMSWAEINKVV